MNGQYQQPLDSLNNDNKYVGLQGLGQGELALWLCRSLPMAGRDGHMLSPFPLNSLPPGGTPTVEA